MRLGVIGRADSRGLAYQSQAYVKHLNVERVYGIDMEKLSPYPNDWSSFTDHCSEVTIQRYSQLDEQELRRWMRGLDVILSAETFYVEAIPNWAREEGVKTVLHINPEFSSWHIPRSTVPLPDVLINPTTWRNEEPLYSLHLPMPVDREDFPFTLRTEAKRFVHTAGHRAAADRAGTRIVISTISRLKNIDITIRSQSPLGVSSPWLGGKVIEGNVGSRNELYDSADVVLLPRRYGGNHLVYNEAVSSGCPVICLDREPENTWGGNVTIPSRARSKLRTKGGAIPVYDGGGAHLIRAIQELAGNPERVQQLSHEADQYAASIDWVKMAPVYEEFLKAVVDEQGRDVLQRIASPLLPASSSDIQSSP